MSIRLKTTLIIVGTLIIGIIIGSLGSGALLRRRVRNFGERPVKDLFVEGFERMVRPEENQRDTIRIILEGYAPKFKAIHESHVASLDSLLDSLDVDLEEVLTPEQVERMKERRRRLHRAFGGPPPPGPHGPGGDRFPDHPGDRPEREEGP